MNPRSETDRDVGNTKRVGNTSGETHRNVGNTKRVGRTIRAVCGSVVCRQKGKRTYCDVPELTSAADPVVLAMTAESFERARNCAI